MRHEFICGNTRVLTLCESPSDVPDTLEPEERLGNLIIPEGLLNDFTLNIFYTRYTRLGTVWTPIFPNAVYHHVFWPDVTLFKPEEKVLYCATIENRNRKFRSRSGCLVEVKT